jgi:hypothetical protein
VLNTYDSKTLFADYVLLCKKVKNEQISRRTQVIKLTLQPSLTPHVTEEPSGTFMSTILNSAMESNLQRPPKLLEEMKVPEM